MNRCAFCFESESVTDLPGNHVAICASCLKAELCYFCRRAPSTMAPLNPRTGILYPTCSACWAKQVHIASATNKAKLAWVGVAFLVIAILSRAC